MTFYRWAMRNGAIILFIASLLIFVVTFAARFFLFGSELEASLNQSGMMDVKMNVFANIFGALGQAAAATVLSFFGACPLYRLDHHWTAREEPRA